MLTATSSVILHLLQTHFKKIAIDGISVLVVALQSCRLYYLTKIIFSTYDYRFSCTSIKYKSDIDSIVLTESVDQ